MWGASPLWLGAPRGQNRERVLLPHYSLLSPASCSLLHEHVCFALLPTTCHSRQDLLKPWAENQSKTKQYNPKKNSLYPNWLFVCVSVTRSHWYEPLSCFQDFPIVRHAAVSMKVKYWVSDFLATFIGKWFLDHPISIFNLGGIWILLSTPSLTFKSCGKRHAL